MLFLPIYRGYAEGKLQENLDAEIFEVLLEEAKASYDEEIVIDMTSENDGDIESNCDRIVTWVKSWKESHSGTAD